MPLSEPRWWYGRSAGLEATLLAPIASIYGCIARRRIETASPFRPAAPVICVGNLTAGGTGKTPLSLAIADVVAGLGGSPVFLTRGYSGRERGPVWVDPCRHTARDVGDETLLLAARGPTVVSRRRDLGADLAAREGPMGCVIIMDDGLQNPQPAKDLTIAVIDVRRGLGNGRVIPAGPLRAPAAFQLGLINAIALNHGAVGRDEARPIDASPLPAMLREMAFGGVVLDARITPVGDVSWLDGARVLAFAGIANPDRFFNLLRRLGADVVETRSFPDHAPLSESDVAALLDEARRGRLHLVTTEKDLARLYGQDGRGAELAEQVRCLRVAAAFDTGSRTELERLITERCLKQNL